jgi:DNA repair protein RadC
LHRQFKQTNKKGTAMQTQTTYRNFRYAKTELRQLVWRFRDVEDIPQGFTRDKAIRQPEDLFNNYHFLFDDYTNERFVVFLLDSKNCIKAVDIVTEGTLNASLVHPREVFRAAIVGTCAAIIVAHNHPSGNPEPSSEDVSVTRQLVEAGKIIGIPVHDHVIFARDKYTSFAERGLI